jgi:hypothetical protein
MNPADTFEHAIRMADDKTRIATPAPKKHVVTNQNIVDMLVTMGRTDPDTLTSGDIVNAYDMLVSDAERAGLRKEKHRGWWSKGTFIVLSEKRLNAVSNLIQTLHDKTYAKYKPWAEAVRRVAEEHYAKYLANRDEVYGSRQRTMLRDVKDMRKIADLIAKGRLQEAHESVKRLDSTVRDLLPQIVLDIGDDY